MNARAVLSCLVLAACDPGLPGVTLGNDGVLWIDDSPGGNVFAFERAYRHWVDDARVMRAEVHHWCASGCTQILSYLPPQNICLSPAARFGFHPVYYERQLAAWPARTSDRSWRGDVDPIGTMIEFLGYPEWLQNRLSQAGVMSFGDAALVIGASEFWAHGYAHCSH